MEKKSSVAFEVPLSVSREVIWASAVLNAKGRCPAADLVPEVYASVEGSFPSIGTVLRVKFNNGLSDCKWTFTALDLEGCGTTWTWVEEEGPMAMRSHVVSLLYVATGEASCSARFSITFDGQVSAEYAQAFKETLTRTVLLFSSRIHSTTQPN